MSPRENSRRRRLPGAAPRTILVYCGGDRTEPDYFDGLRVSLRSSRVTVKVRKESIAPDALVRAASAYRDRRPNVFDEIWCVVDVDQFDIDAASLEARRYGVSLAVSNPCFEFWLLLHHVDRRSYCADCTEVVRLLRKYVPRYDKARLRFNDFTMGMTPAVDRARKLDATGEHWRRNPSTGVWRLVEQIAGKP
jgi:RloB-like protein